MKGQRSFRSIIGSPLRTRTRLLLGLGGFAVVVLLYIWYRHSNIASGGNERFTPGLSDLTKALDELFTVDKRSEKIPFWTDTKASLLVLLRSFGWGFLISVIVGILMGVFSTVNAAVSPVAIALSKVPPLSALFVFFVIFGTTTDKFRVALIVFGIGPTIALGISIIGQAIPKNIIVKAYSLGASTPEVVIKAILPLMLPHIIQTMRLAIGPGWVYLIATEYIAASEGIGYRMALASRSLNISQIFVYIVWLSILGLVMDYILAVISRLVAPWAAARKDD